MLQMQKLEKHGMMHTDIEIKRSSDDNLKDIANIEEQCFSMPWNLSSIENEFSHEFSEIYVACSNERTIGYLIIYIFGNEAEIVRIAVEKEYRKLGVASALINEAFLNFIGDIFIEVRVNNIAALALYKKLGFNELNIRKDYYTNPTEDALIMKKHIEDKT